MDDFITQCQRPMTAGSACARQTVFFFPGGMASRLSRATQKFDDDDPSPQTFNYDPVWVTPATPFGGAQDLAMHRDSAGTFRDKGDRIIVADAALSLDLLLDQCTPHDRFIEWCRNNNIDLFVFPWDWRRRLDETVSFFVGKFLQRFRAYVMAAGCPDPIASFAIVGHSFGGMIANLILRGDAPLVVNALTQAITVATPFYGYAGQLHRWFEGDDLLNFFGFLEQEMMETIASLPGLYTLHFLDEATYDANETALRSGPFPIPDYPSVDETYKGVRADPYNPATYGNLVRYPGLTGFDLNELEYAELQFKALIFPMDQNHLRKFHNIRGVKTANDQKTPVPSTVGSASWNWIPPNYDADDNTPIRDGGKLPGDGVQPAWTTCMVTNSARCVTVLGSTIDHAFMMNDTGVINAIQAILCPMGGGVGPTETAEPESSPDEEIVEFLKWLSQNLLVVKRLKRFDDPEFEKLLRESRFKGRLPNIARRFIGDVMKRSGPEGLRPPKPPARKAPKKNQP
jgi:hypothetical protein